MKKSASEPRIWRVVAAHPVPRSEIQYKSLHLGDWLRRNYVSIGFDKKKQNQPMARFRDEMKKGDRVVVTTDGYIWAMGEITGPMYEREEPELYSNRRDVLWYKVTRKDVKSFPAKLRNKLSQRPTVIPLSDSEWSTILASI